MSPLFDDAEVRALIESWIEEATGPDSAAFRVAVLALDADDQDGFERALRHKDDPFIAKDEVLLGEFSVVPPMALLRKRFGESVRVYRDGRRGRVVVTRKLDEPVFNREPLNPYYVGQLWHPTKGTALPY